MIFRTYEHYPPNEVLIFESNYDDMCIICFHHNTQFNQLINLNVQTLYITQCNCNALIHAHCLRLWHTHSQKCPICRSDMISTPQKKTIIFTFERTISFLYTFVLTHFVYVVFNYILSNYNSPHEL